MVCDGSLIDTEWSPARASDGPGTAREDDAADSLTSGNSEIMITFHEG
jgi:hypothetical protein